MPPPLATRPRHDRLPRLESDRGQRSRRSFSPSSSTIWRWLSLYALPFRLRRVNLSAWKTASAQGLMSSEAEFELFGSPTGRTIPYKMSVRVEDRSISWVSPTGPGRLEFDDVAVIELVLGDPDGDERPDHCTIHTAAGPAFRVYCEYGGMRKNRQDRRRAYSEFLIALHQRLSPEDRSRISFKTDGKLSPKAERLIVVQYLASTTLSFVLWCFFGHPMAICLGFVGFQIVFAIAVFSLIPKTPLHYSPDPLDERYLPR